jgi:3-methyl-2-oxobutanoate hydroxymethyltransferase
VLIDGGYKVKGRNKFDWGKYIDDAIAIEEAGAFSVVLEGMVEPLAAEITSRISIPTIGIGASPNCDGQVLVTEDMLGLTNIAPKFVKKYADLESLIKKAAHQYADEVRNREFPSKEHTYAMNPQIVRKGDED